MNTASTTTPSQRETNTIPIAKTASTMFAMDAMLTRWPDQLKMPRQDAYDEGGKLKNDQLRDLAKTACWLALVPLLVYLALCLCAPKGTPLHQQLLKLTVQPEAFGCFMLLWTGCFLGVVLSYGARTTTMTLADLISPSPDRLLPRARLLFAGSLTLVVGLFLAVELVEIKIGSVSSKKIMIEPMIAFLIGVACGMSQLALPASVTKKIGELLPIK